MGKSPNSDTNDVPKDSTGASVSYALVGTIADTTWRMFVPSIGFTLLGVWLDATLHTKPWLMFAGIVIGAGFAGLLVRRQIMALKEKDRGGRV